MEPTLKANGLTVLQARHLRKNACGQSIEKPAEMFARVASHVAEVERRYDGNAATMADPFYDALARLEFLPNSPALMNAGTPLSQLAACFVLPIDDSLDSIFGSLRDAALVHQTGGGVGYDFSRLRPKGDTVAATGGDVGCNQQCTFCQNRDIERYAFAVRENRIKDGRCPACEMPIAGIEMDAVNRRPSAA